ncbi:hypothetical protein GJ689_07760 [Rhodoplanes serenus]|uniref:Uncharacterized protein n=1 Tax=Rhodoplanes serenus TaxID=200615 RepID=A0A9X4XK42_9BRAD|nr:hypothetical protein [Rhodoplanes serenus]MTW16102.1 hypothetical protein [Rhodoplanes serenus]
MLSMRVYDVDGNRHPDFEVQLDTVREPEDFYTNFARRTLRTIRTAGNTEAFTVAFFDDGRRIVSWSMVQESARMAVE